MDGTGVTGSRRPRVLVADDYAELLQSFARFLAASCDVVGCVGDGQAALDAAERLRPDVVVIDLFIPPSNGIEICRRLKQSDPALCVVVISASGDAQTGEEAIRAGASAFVSKLRALDDLLPAIERAWAARAAQ